MKNLYVYSYNATSKGASELSEALGVPRIRHNNSRFIGSSRKTVINWGSSEVSKEVLKCRILNAPSIVSIVSNKLLFFKSMTDASDPPRCVPWTTSKKEAEEWLKQGSTVVVRNILTGHSGNGVVIVEPGQEVPNAPLYTQYIPKSAEYRVHIIGGKIIFEQRKIKNPQIDQPITWKIRSHENGFIFQHNNLSVPKDVEDQALKAVSAIGLDFGGVDIVWVEKQKRAYILEINTACGLEGATVGAYANGFRESLK